MAKHVAYSIKEMRRGDIYVDDEGSVLVRDSESTDYLHHIGPFGDHWKVQHALSWPVTRVYKQDRGECEDPRPRKKNRV